MARIVAVAPAAPPHRHTQHDITTTIAPLITSDPRTRALLARFHAGSGVETRSLALPLAEYQAPRDFTASNELFVRIATDLAEEAARSALAAAAIAPHEVDFIVFTTVTGVSAPSIDALLVARLGLRTDVRRVPMYGLGCVAGAAGLARVDDLLAGHPLAVALFVAVELCSLTFQRDDSSTANLVASGLFGDGAAAAVVVGDQRAERMPGADIVATRSALYPDTSHVIGFDAGSTGFRIVLTAEVSDVIARHVGDDARAFLADAGIERVDTWIAHPGGPRVLDAFAEALDVPDGAFDASWASLARSGNMSSVSVLAILADVFAQPAGTVGLLFALGPGVTGELVALRWE